MKSNQLYGIVLAIFVSIVLLVFPLPNQISDTARQTLVITIAAVIFWVFRVSHPAADFD